MDVPDGAAAGPATLAEARCLPGANRYYPVPAVVLHPLGAVARDGAVQGRWIARVVDMARALGWPDPLPRVQALDPPGPDGAPTCLAFAAPADGLHTAVALGGWAWAAATDPAAAHPLGPDPVPHFRALAQAEARPALAALASLADERGVPLLASEAGITLGEGAGSIHYPAPSLPEPQAIPWPKLHAVPKLLVTGSHGKTSVLRVLEAVAREAGLAPGVAGSPGAADAHAVLRDPAAGVALLELPVAQLSRQGLPVRQAQVAVITQVATEGVAGGAEQPLDEAAACMLVVAHAVAAGGTLVMNGDDQAVLRVALGLAHAAAPTWALFGREHGAPLLDALRRHGGSTCAPCDGRLLLAVGGLVHDLGALVDMPLTLGGHSPQGIANVSAAALAAGLAGWPLAALRPVLARFGATPQDNPGRLERWQHHGATVLLDSARDAHGLGQLLKLAGALGARRVGLLLGQPAAHRDEAIRRVALAAAGYRPDRVLITEWGAEWGAEWGPEWWGPGSREPGAVPLLLEQGLRGAGLSARALRHEHEPLAAVRALLAWARPGDVLLLPLPTAGPQEALLGACRALFNP
jgi:hypothetical protein